jgi:hypothetical protein
MLIGLGYDALLAIIEAELAREVVPVAAIAWCLRSRLQ